MPVKDVRRGFERFPRRHIIGVGEDAPASNSAINSKTESRYQERENGRRFPREWPLTPQPRTGATILPARSPESRMSTQPQRRRTHPSPSITEPAKNAAFVIKNFARCLNSLLPKLLHRAPTADAYSAANAQQQQQQHFFKPSVDYNS